MRRRAVDVALLVGLVLVAGAIVWTLFSLGRDPAPGPSRSGADAPVETPAPDGDEAGIVPVRPGADGAGDDATEGADEDAADADASAAGDDAAGDEEDAGGDGADAADAGDDEAAAEDEAAAGGVTLDRPDPEVPAAEAPPLPEDGPVDLGRIGFSYVTGGAGACGVVLEAWTHVAVSRELLQEYGCGAEVRVEFDEEIAGRTSFDAVIGDTMNPAFSRTVNVYVGEDEPAFEFGLTTGTLTPSD